MVCKARRACLMSDVSSNVRGVWSILPDALAGAVDEASSACNGVASAALPGANQKATDLVLPIQGVIRRETTSHIRSWVRRGADDPSVTRIVLAFHSPGGTTDGIPETAETIRHASTHKAVIAVADSLAASAAYWLASAASELVAAPSAEVGAIGVFALHTDMTAAFERAGMRVNVIHAGEHKVETTPFVSLSEDARAAIQRRLDVLHKMFIEDVAQGRGRSASDVADLFGRGRLFGATDALDRGMVDRIATLDEVLASGPTTISRSRATAMMRTRRRCFARLFDA